MREFNQNIVIDEYSIKRANMNYDKEGILIHNGLVLYIPPFKNPRLHVIIINHQKTEIRHMSVVNKKVKVQNS